MMLFSCQKEILSKNRNFGKANVGCKISPSQNFELLCPLVGGVEFGLLLY